MKLKFTATGIAMLLLTLTSCQDTTDTIGSTLIDNEDKLNVATDTFNVSSESIYAGSVLSRNTNGFLGKMLDPETATFVKGDVMTQFHTLSSYNMVDESTISSKDSNGKIIADSCEIRLFYDDFTGDSLAQLKMKVYEMKKPMEENRNYYSDFDPISQGYVNTDGLSMNRVYTLADHTQPNSERYSDSYTNNIKIKLDKAYTDRNNVTYNNYGTYLLRKYYENPANFHNSYKFLNNICPGFFFQITDGYGSMATISRVSIYIYFKHISDGKEINAATSFTSTEEVLQTTTFTNDEAALKELVNDETSTYLKTPAGIFTVLTLPIEDKVVNVNGEARTINGILTGHENDSINTAKIEIPRMNNQVISDYSLPVPQTLLMIPVDEIVSFFEQSKIADYRTSYLATYSSTANSYTFNNISGLVNSMIKKRNDGTESETWNKVVIIPVNTEYGKSSSSSSTSTLSKVMHNMSLTSTRLLKGTDFNSPIKMSVIYGKFYGR